MTVLTRPACLLALIVTLLAGRAFVGAAAPQVVELLPLIDLKQNSIGGKWSGDGTALTADGSAYALLSIPYDPPEEYDFIIEFTRLKGHDQVVQIFRYGDSELVWSMGSRGKEMRLTADKRELARKDDRAITTNGVKTTSIVQVRRSGVQVLVDGRMVAQVNDKVNEAKLPSHWKHLADAPLGIGAWYHAPTSFTRIAIIIPAGGTPGRVIKSGESYHDSPRTDSDVSKRIIDVVVPSAPAPDAPSSAPSAAPFDPAVIERPEYRDAPKLLVKSLTSVTSMMVTIDEDGEAHGLTSDIIAVVPRASRRLDTAGIGFVGVDGDEMMKTALEEAVRAVTLRYPLWQPGHIDLSFGEKFVTHGGPSAGTAFGLLMLSALEGFSIDPKCAVTGDITVDWKVRKVGGVTAKLHGATLDKCLYAAIPAENEAAFADMACLYGPSSLWNIQVVSIATLQEAVAIAEQERPAPLKQALRLFADLQSQLNKSDAILHSAGTQETLKKILALAPNHLSAKYLLAVSDGSASKTLSKSGTLYRLSVIFHPYRVVLTNGAGLNRTTLPAYVTTVARKRLAALRPIANADLQPLVRDIAALITAMDEFAGGTTSAKAVISHAQAVDGRFAALGSDPDFAEKLVREGY